jgi:glutathione S-transferase
MDLYFAPLACSLASRIAIYEAGLEARMHEVVLSTKQTRDGQDYSAINPKGQVPALRTSEGEVLTEGAAVLQYLADLKPDSGLAPPAGELDRVRLQAWLNYIGTEVHKGCFYLLFSPESPPEAKAFAKTQLGRKLDYLAEHLTEREVLVGEGFTVADAYLVTVLNWTQAIRVDLADWPALKRYRDRHLRRPAVARALREELALREAA